MYAYQIIMLSTLNIPTSIFQFYLYEAREGKNGKEANRTSGKEKQVRFHKNKNAIMSEN